MTLPRKYRPDCLENVIGQDYHVKILNYIFRNDLFYQGYIFSGQKGTGKTSLARIIARTANCKNLDKSGEFVKCCGICVSCEAKNHPDIIEIDAASNTGIDNIREEVITESNYSPIIGKCKVFIIDEAHMLSKSAFNALLKTLEEPISSAIFILATTEIEKVPVTIISRCQRFNLNNISSNDIIHLLKKVSVKENINFSDKVLVTISKIAEGSARDSLNILEHVHLLYLSDHKKDIDSNIVDELLGSVSYERILDLVELITENKVEEILKLLKPKINFKCLTNNFLEILSFLAKYSITRNCESDFWISDDIKNRVSDLASKIDIKLVLRMWKVLIKYSDTIRYAENQKAWFEMIVFLMIEDLKSFDKNSLKEPENKVIDDQKKPYSKEEKRSYDKKDIDNKENTHNKEEFGDRHIGDSYIRLFESQFQERISLLSKLANYMNENFEFEIYYYLMNECNFFLENSVVKVLNIKFDLKLNRKLDQIISSSLDKKTEFISHKHALSLKSELMDKFHNSKEFEDLKNNFKELNIQDLLYKC